MPINSTITINGSVGRRGRNSPTDVRAVQGRLNDLTRPPRLFLKVDGKSGPLTEGVIADFQRVVCGSANPDGRVDPGKKTLAALNDPSSEGKWLGMNMTTPTSRPGAAAAAGVVYPAGLNSREKEAVDLMAKSTKNAEELGILNDFLKSTPVSTLKAVLNAQGAAAGLIQFGVVVREQRALGSTAKQIGEFLGDAVKMKDATGFAKILDAGGRNPGMFRVAKGLGKVASGAATFLCAVELADHLMAKRWGAAAGEVYGAFMGKAVPWAGLMSALQGLVFVYAPGLKGRPTITYFFQILNAVDPINMGKIAVDSLITVVETALTSFERGQLDTRKLEELVDRMKQTPARVFAETGEWWGDFFADLLKK